MNNSDIVCQKWSLEMLPKILVCFVAIYFTIQCLLSERQLCIDEGISSEIENLDGSRDLMTSFSGIPIADSIIL